MSKGAREKLQSVVNLLDGQGSQAYYPVELDGALQDLAAEEDLDPREAANYVRRALSPSSASSGTGMSLLESSTLWLSVGIVISLLFSVATSTLITWMIVENAREDLRTDIVEPVAQPVSPNVEGGERTPATLLFLAGERSLQAGGSSETTIEVAVFDHLGRLIDKDAKVKFRVDPEAGGKVDSEPIRVKDGIARTVFIAGPDAGTVEIVAQAEDATGSFAIQLQPAPTPSLHITLSSDPSSMVRPGDRVTYTLIATNLGPVPASEVEVSCAIPDGATFVSAPGSEERDDPREVLWRIGELSPASVQNLRLVVAVLANTDQVQQLSEPAHWIRGKDGDKIYGEEGPPLTVEYEETTQGPLEISVQTSPLLAGEPPTAMVTITVSGQPIPPAEGITVTLHVSPTFRGTLDPPEIMALIGQPITVTYTVSDTAGPAELIASNHSYSATRKVSLPEP